jgi:spermidine/putrescine transport system ATP-binding protein
MQSLLEIRKVGKNFGTKEILKGVSLNVASGEFLTILGESGSGKTTLLRLIAGFEKATAGEIWMDSGAGLARMDLLPPYKRQVNTVFQNYALFPHLSVFENVAYGLRVKNHVKAEIPQLVNDGLRQVKMHDFADRMPGKLSGGQQQRVALARAIVNKPKLLLLDEPLSALDANLRHDMQAEIKSLQKNLGITFIFVTHDQNEAMALSDRIVLLRKGAIEQVASPRDIYNKPATSYTARFIGQTNLLTCEVRGQTAHWHGLAWGYSPATSSAPVFSLRPERIKLFKENEKTDGLIRFKARVANLVFEGGTDHLDLICEDGGELKARMASSPSLAADIGSHAEFVFASSDLVEVQN